jgi:cytochrome c oxidase subunit I
MISVESDAPPAPVPQQSGHSSWLFSTSHKTIGIQYLFLAFAAVVVGVILSILIRFRMVWPGAHIPFVPSAGISQAQFDAAVAMHGTIMLFFVLAITAQSGLGTFLLPLQIGAREMAAPRLNAAAFWGTCISFLGVLGSVLLPGENSGQTVWVASICLFCVCAVLSALNLIVTTVDCRAEGLRLGQMPLTAWSWFIAAILILMTCSIELASGSLFILDRVAGTAFFYSPDAVVAGGFRDIFGNSTLTWSHLFWFFGDPFVYIVLLPAIGIVSHVLSVFCRRPLLGSRLAVVLICALGFFGFAIWGRHMFVNGMSPYAVFSFSVLALSIGVPAMAMTLLWLATLWRSRIERTTAMRFTLGFVALFVTGGVSGLFLALPAVQIALQGPDFAAGHFHLILAMAAVFAIFAGIYFWFPRMFGRALDERLGKIHFWVTFAGAYAIFVPLHFLGLQFSSGPSGAQSEHVRVLAETWLAAVPGIAAMITGAAQLIFALNFWRSLRKPALSSQNPWNAVGFEWALRSETESRRKGNLATTLTTVLLGGLLVFFMALVSAYLIRRGYPENGASAFAAPRAVWIGVALLICATLATVRGCSLLRSNAAGKNRTIKRWLIGGSLLGILFLLTQAEVARELFLHIGQPSAINPSASYFLLFGILQGVLVACGIGINWKAAKTKAAGLQTSLAEPLSIYWNFSAGLWVFLLFLFMLKVQGHG